MASKLKRICITPRVSGVGGMVSFAAKFSAGLHQRGIEVTYDLDDTYDAVLVIGGTWRNLVGLRRAKRKGIPIVQRLDGINWLHRKTRTGLRHWLRAESANWLLAYIRARLATRVVYQSHFVVEWWQQKEGDGPASRVNYNGVDLELFTPTGPEPPPADKIRILMVEGSLQGGYELGLESAVALANKIQSEHGRQAELVIAGRVDEASKQKWTQRSQISIDWRGVVPNADVPALNRSAHFLYSSDLNAACPNSVIEALACGLPVLAFDTGALKELVPTSAGRIVAYGGDPWKLDPPDINALTQGALEILESQSALRAGARKHAEQAFSLDRMVDAYLEALSG
jgi:glycosyltransferase involved in cell wall biosynthesis